VRFPTDSRLIVIVVGDEAGEEGPALAKVFQHYGYDVAAMALLVNVAHTRGLTVRNCATSLSVPFSEVKIEQFDDPYQVPRVLKALLDAPRFASKQQFGLVERVMATPLLEPPSL
jgi:hypothetical protein